MKYLILSFTLINCYSNLFGQERIADKGYVIKNQIIEFSNSATFLKTFNYLVSISNDVKMLDKWEKSNNLISYRSVINDIYSEFGDNQTFLENTIKRNNLLFRFDNKDSTYHEIIEDKVLSSICNKNGIFKVGKEYIKVYNNYLVKFQVLSPENLDVLNKYCSIGMDTADQSTMNFKIEKFKNDLEIENKIARGNGPCKNFNEVAAYGPNSRKIKLQLYRLTLYNNTFIVCGSISFKNGIKYKTNHTLDIYSIKVTTPTYTWTKTNLTNYQCSEVRECTPVYAFLGSTNYNYTIIQANIRATHRGMDGTYATFVCP